MTRFITVSFAMALLLPTVSFAKRSAPVKVEPVIYQGVRFSAPNDDGRRGYIEAWDIQTNKKLWDLTVFTNHIDPNLEEDVQWVFIKMLKIQGNVLLVTSEHDKTYRVDLKAKAVIQSGQPNTTRAPSTTVAPTVVSALRSIESFRFIGAATTIQEVEAKLGKPDRDVGSGIYIYEYLLTNGTRIWIGSSDNSRIIYVRHGISSLDDSEVLYPRQ